MHFTFFFVAGVFVITAAAQSKTDSTSRAQQSQADCLDACKAGDVNCQSQCITVEEPDEENIEATTKCIATCPQGNGSESDTEKYSVCAQKCVDDNYRISESGTPRETAAASDKDEVSSAEASATSTGSAVPPTSIISTSPATVSIVTVIVSEEKARPSATTATTTSSAPLIDDTDKDDDKPGMSVGTKAGIGVGVAAAASLAAGAGVFLCWRRRQNQARGSLESAIEPTGTANAWKSPSSGPPPQEMPTDEKPIYEMQQPYQRVELAA
ncbi:hypothetical protein NW762_005433 [Fusarium torreyae]|uniref:Extracellular membrane protein CFEM domain-containing protein n=1 Tax=Fusarium torreyae TaxID=1237075 RepID=A0A9W8S1P3_9HYPO|nr:hypothetical protein NW762_005433 [Fusarium torreyae]